MSGLGALRLAGAVGLLLIALVGLFAGPVRAESPSPDPTATPTAEPSPSPEPTATPTAEPTATPTAEPTATPSPSATPGLTVVSLGEDDRDLLRLVSFSVVLVGGFAVFSLSALTVAAVRR